MAEDQLLADTARAMREAHPAGHPRYQFWLALADLLDAAAHNPYPPPELLRAAVAYSEAAASEAWHGVTIKTAQPGPLIVSADWDVNDRAEALLEQAWGVIANAGWDAADESVAGRSPGWHQAAERWRDAYRARGEAARAVQAAQDRIAEANTIMTGSIALPQDRA